MKKKLYWQTTFGQINIVERAFRIDGKRIRPFSQKMNLSCRGYSVQLQRAIVDFSSDTSFGGTRKKLKEHYGIEIPESSIDKITKTHSNNMLKMNIEDKKADSKSDNCLIAQTDGTMIPIVEIDENKESKQKESDKENNNSTKIDRRKCRKVCWKEARLCFSKQNHSTNKVFSTALGDVNQVGNALHQTACRLGYNDNTYVHGVGDGANWILCQFNKAFEDQKHYLIDFYHVSEYLSAASKYIAPHSSEIWLKEKQQLLKENKHVIVRGVLKRYINKHNLTDPDHPVIACYRYLTNKKQFLNYSDALEKGLPIGSGEIESSHRNVIQKRLKLPGAWWKVDNARSMLSLRALRANDDWELYWQRFNEGKAA